MIQTPKQRQNLDRLLRARAQPVKYDSRYADEAEAMHAHYREFLVQIHGPESIYGDDGRGEKHPYFGGGVGEPREPLFRYWS